ncbi:hypothetical protein AB5I41_12055 [Sphingomonas sp. MMS24-JH45]
MTPAAGVRQRDRLRRELAAARGSGTFPAPTRLASIWERVRVRDLVVVLSDFFRPRRSRWRPGWPMRGARCWRSSC